MDTKHEERVGDAGESDKFHDAAELSRGAWADIGTSLKQGFEKLGKTAQEFAALAPESGRAWHSDGQLREGIDKLSMTAVLNVSSSEFEQQNPAAKGKLSELIGKDGFKMRHATTGELDSGWKLAGINKDGALRLSKDYKLEVESQSKHDGLIETLPGVPADHTKALQRKLDELPQNVLQALQDKGYKIIATRTNSQAIPELKSLTPRGWDKSNTFDDSDGTHDNVRKVILAPLFVGGNELVNRPDVLVHQIGHALDHSFGKLSNDPQFQESFKKDMQAMNKDWALGAHEKAIYNYFDQKEGPGKGERPGSEECFAALFGMILTGPENPGDEKIFQKYFPNTIKVVRDQIKKL